MTPFRCSGSRLEKKICKVLIFGVALGLFLPTAKALTKKEAYARLMEQGPKWRLTQSLPEEAESKYRESRSKTRPLFQLGVNEYVARINPIQFGVDQPVYDTVGFGSTAIEMRWTVFDPVASFEVLTAEAQLDIAKGQAKQYQTDLTALMLIQYLSVQKLKRQLQTVDASLKRSAEILRLAKTKREIGAGIDLDVTRARSLSELDRIKRLQITTKLSKAIDDLALLLGQDAMVDDLEPLGFHPRSVSEMTSLLKQAPDMRSDLQNAHAGVAAAEKLSSAAGSRFYPKLTLLGDVGSTNTSLIGLPPDRATGFLGVRFELPLETGGLLDAKRQGASALSMKALAQEKQTRLEMQNQMKEAIEQIKAAQEATMAAQQYVKSTQQEAKLVDKKFSVGTGSVMDIFNSHNNVASAQDTETEAIFAYESAQVALFRTVGSFDTYFQ